MAKPQGHAKLPGFAAAVARGSHLAIAKDALDALDRAEQRGVPFAQARDEIVASLRADWTTEGSPRVKLTADNAVTQAMQLGRVTALRSPEIAKRRPYWVFSAVLDDQTSETCIDCDGVVLPVGHAWWATHTPSLHLRCRSVIASCTEAQAKQLGITTKPPTVDVEEGFGRPGDLCEWEPRPGEYPAEVYDLIPMTDTTRRNDLGVSDVHVPTTARPRKTTMATLPTKKRNALPDTAFALPETRQFPIHDAAHVRNAAARLEQQKSALGPEKYAAAKRAIVKAAKRFGVNTSLAPATKKKLRTPSQTPDGGTSRRPMPGLGLRRGLRFRIGLMPGGGHQIDVMHAKQPSGDAPAFLCRGATCEMSGDAYAAWSALATAEAEFAALPADAPTRAETEARLVSLRADAAKPVWIQLAKVGKFNGHPAGPFEMTPETFDEIVRNFNATVNRRIPIDFEHASEADGASGSIPQDGAPAQGWITQLDNRGLNGLWGLVEWLEPARTYIREGRYRFFSPAIRFGSRDRVSGKPIGARMTSGALTNVPFLDAMVPVTASDKPGATTMSLDKPMMSHDFMARMRLALRCGDTDTLEKMAAKCGDLRDLCATMDDAMMSQGVDLKPYMTDLAGLMNMPAHTTLGEILDAVEAMINAAIERHVAEYHEGEGDDDDEPLSTPTGATMSDQKDSQSLAVTLGETKAALAVITAEKAALMSERDKLTADNAGLTLRLNEATAKVAAADTEKATLAAEVVTLKEQIATRDAADAEAKVTAAFETYKDARKLTDANKREMRLVLKNDPALFAELYPAVPASQQHLMRNLTGGRLATDQTTQMTGKIPANAMTITAVTEVVAEEQAAKMTGEQVAALTDRLMSEKKMTLKAASILAGNIAAGKAQSPFAN